jgi:DNA primase
MSQAYIDFAFVKENASFERILAHYNLEARGAGARRSLLCPFHPDKRPSCRVELDKKIFHCFACDASGNILEFVARIEGDADDLRSAAETIAEICKIPLAPPRRAATTPVKRMPARRGRRREAATARREPAAAQRAAAPPMADTDLDAGLIKRRPRGAAKVAAGATTVMAVNAPLTFALKLDAGHPYLTERGVSAEIVAQFGLGYCSRGVMAGRVCIPIHDAAGQLVAYAGRWPGEPPEEVERYLLPKRFEKSRVLFNLHRVSDAEHVVLVEGYWSAFRLHALHVPVAGLMGASVAEQQIAVLRDRGTRFVTLLLDGDDAGRKARERALPALASAFFVRAPVLPDGEKPDTLGEAELRHLVDPS